MGTMLFMPVPVCCQQHSHTYSVFIFGVVDIRNSDGFKCVHITLSSSSVQGSPLIERIVGAILVNVVLI